MHALTILQRHLALLPTGIHARRLATLLDAVAATVSGPRLTLTDIGRRFGGEATLRNRIKCSDRLLGNHHLQGQARTIYAALARKLLGGILEGKGARLNYVLLRFPDLIDPGPCSEKTKRRGLDLFLGLGAGPRHKSRPDPGPSDPGPSGGFKTAVNLTEYAASEGYQLDR